MKKIVNEPREIDGMRVVQDSWEIAEALKNGETVLHWEALNLYAAIDKPHGVLQNNALCSNRCEKR